MNLLVRLRAAALAAAACLLAAVCVFVSARADDPGMSMGEIDTLKTELDKIASGSGDRRTMQKEAARKAEFIKSELLRTVDSITETEEKEKQHYENMKVRIKYLYETGEASFLEILFSSENMPEFLERVEFIRNIGEYDSRMMEDLGRLHRSLIARKNALLSLKKFADDLKKPRFIYSDSSTIDKGVMRVPASEQTLLAAIVQCEAPPEYDAQLAVATVVLNRVESPRFANSISEVVFSADQFQPVVLGTLGAALEEGPSPLAMQVAQDALGGKRLKSVSGCYYFLYVGIADRDGVRVGDNVFFPVW